MTIISIIGGHDREAIQTFLNILITAGGVTEVRILQMGTTAYFQDLVMELCLVHDIDRIYGVDMQGLMNRNGEFPQVLVFMNSSYRPLEEFCSVAFPLVDFTVQELLKAEVEALNILFGDNYRGLLQKAYMDKLLRDSESDTKEIHSVAISSIYQISKILNSAETSSRFRCYPKVDGSIYVFDPTGSLSDESSEKLREELEAKIGMIEKLFTMKSSCAYPNIEGSVLARFIGTYIQTQEWDTACRDDELYSRCPTKSEVTYYGLDSEVAVFLPPAGDDVDTEADRLPDLVKKHVKEASAFIISKM